MHHRHTFRVFLAITLLVALALFGTCGIMPLRTAHAAAQPSPGTPRYLKPGQKVADGVFNGTSVLASQVHGQLSPGTRIVYDATCAQPPAQSLKDHAAFSDAEVAQYGLPQRPKRNAYGTAKSFTAALVYWQNEVRNLNYRSCDAIIGTQKHGWANSFIWGGRGIYDPHFQAVSDGGQGDWNIPCDGTEPQGLAKASMWIGNGGMQNNELVQAGSEDQSMLGFPSQWMWVEWLGDRNNNYAEQQIFQNVPSNKQVQCGDSIHIATEYNCIYAEDSTRGDYYPTVCDNNAPLPDYSSFEAITEAVGHDSGYVLFNYYPAVNFHNLQVRNMNSTFYPMQWIGTAYTWYLKNDANTYNLEDSSPLVVDVAGTSSKFTMTFNISG